MKYTKGQQHVIKREVRAGNNVFPAGSTFEIHEIDESKKETPYILYFVEQGIINFDFSEKQLDYYTSGGEEVKAIQGMPEPAEEPAEDEEEEWSTGDDGNDETGEKELEGLGADSMILYIRELKREKVAFDEQCRWMLVNRTNHPELKNNLAAAKKKLDFAFGNLISCVEQVEPRTSDEAIRVFTKAETDAHYEEYLLAIRIVSTHMDKVREVEGQMVGEEKEEPTLEQGETQTMYVGVDWATESDQTHRTVVIGDITRKIAAICHNVNKAYCESIGDFSQPTWGEAPDWQKESAINGVVAHLDGDLTPEQSHENWMKEKIEAGWVYGEHKDANAKTHHCILPYNELPEAQRMKDHLFKAVVESFK